MKVHECVRIPLTQMFECRGCGAVMLWFETAAHVVANQFVVR